MIETRKQDNLERIRKENIEAPFILHSNHINGTISFPFLFVSNMSIIGHRVGGNS